MGWGSFLCEDTDRYRRDVMNRSGRNSDSVRLGNGARPLDFVIGRFWTRKASVSSRA
jgi:hypothetical protein